MLVPVTDRCQMEQRSMALFSVVKLLPAFGVAAPASLVKMFFIRETESACCARCSSGDRKVFCGKITVVVRPTGRSQF